MEEQISITEALKLWLGNSFTSDDIFIYNIQKQYKWYDLFFFDNHFLGGPEHIDFTKDLVNKSFILSIVEKYKNKKGHRKLKNILFEGDIEDLNDPDFIIMPSNFDTNISMVYVINKNY